MISNTTAANHIYTEFSKTLGLISPGAENKNFTRKNPLYAYIYIILCPKMSMRHEWVKNIPGVDSAGVTK